MRMKKTMRSPNLSVHMPSGRRMSEPVSTGMAASSPNCVSLRPSVFLIGMPITANIIQTAKQIVNASVLETSTDHCFLLLASIPDPIHHLFVQGEFTAGRQRPG